MPGFGDFGFPLDFGDFGFDDAAEEDPYGIGGGATRDWWNSQPYNPYGTKKKSRVGGYSGGHVNPTGGWQGVTTRKTDSVYPNMGPDPSTTQRAILDAKQKQEDAARIFGGEAPRDTGANGDFDLGGGGVLKYQAPDPTNPGHQDAARERMDISLQDYNDYFANKEAIKKLEDEAYALPKRTGFGGAFDRQRDAAYQRAEVLRRRNAEIRAGNPAAFGGSGDTYDPNRYKTVGNLVFDARSGKYVVPDEGTLAAMHRTASAGKTAAPHLETLIEPRTGKTVRVDQAAVPRNAQGQLVVRYFQRDPKRQGPQQPGVDSLGETKEEPYGVPDPAAVQAAQYRHENPAPEKPPKEPAVSPLSIVKEKQGIQDEFDKRIGEVKNSSAWKQGRPEAVKEVEGLERERNKRIAEVEATGRRESSGGGGGAGGLPDKAISAIKAGGGRPVTFKNGKTYVWKNGSPQEVK